MTGSKVLWSKLCCQNSVKSIIIGNEFVKFKLWPAYLKELPSIQSLEIISHSDQWWNLLQLKLNMLPRTLRKLSIFNVRLDNSSFFLKSDGTALILGDHVPLLEELRLNIHWDPNSAWMVRLPQNLTKLHCISFSKGMSPPSSVTNLVLDEVLVIRRADEHFFPNLVSIRACGISFIPDLSPDFHSLIISDMYEQYRLGPNCLAHLPKSLTRLEILVYPETIYSEPQLCNDPQSFVPILPNLTTLNTIRLPAECWAFLPRGLTNLSIRKIPSISAILSLEKINPLNGETVHSRTIPIHLLPRSITELSLQFRQLTFIDCHDVSSTPDTNTQHETGIFPPFLAMLQLSEAQLSVTAAKQLPSSLQVLSISNIDSSICEHLPRRLTKLDCTRVVFSPDLIKFLPKSITKLDLFYLATSSDINWINPFTCQPTSVRAMMTDYSLVHTDESNLLWHNEFRLPSSINHLSLRGFKRTGDSLLDQNLPNLEFLDVAFSDLWTDLAIPHLPQHLKFLNLREASKVTGKCFKDLPRGLTWFNLSASSQIADSDIKHLPAYLEELFLFNAVYLTEASIKDFPKRLKRLHLTKNTTISDQVFLDLPINIQLSPDYEPFSAAD